MDISSYDNSKTTNFKCFYPDDNINPCSSKACFSDIGSILTPDSEEVEIIKVKLCTDPQTNRLGAIWEINFSRSNESNKLEGFFVEKARERFRELQNVPDFNTQLSFVSIVGGRGVGKSTVASLLSGNASMFTVIIHAKNCYEMIYNINIIFCLGWKWNNWNYNNWCRCVTCYSCFRMGQNSWPSFESSCHRS